ncbi:unnamed protein product [Trichobilharzia regenti]|nr:unnamed protein product [Trichobilharzia regenti]
MTSTIQPNMLHSHLSAPMAQVPHRLSQQTSFHGHTKRHYRRQQSSGSITSTSRDFSTGRGMNRGSDYPQKQLTRKPRPASSHMPRDKRYSQSKEQSFLHQHPYTHLQDIKKDKKERLTNKEKMYYRRRLLEMQHTNDSSGSNSNPNRNDDDNNARHFHPLPVNPEDAYAQRYSQTLNAPYYKNKKREVHDSRRMQSVNTVDYHPKKSNLDEIVGLAPNDCHWFNYHSHNFNVPRDSTNDWGPNKPQMSSSYHQEIPSGLIGGQQSQFGLNSLESFQQGCLTSLASMLLCPHTILPIMVGLFSNFGSSCDYVQRLGGELKKSSKKFVTLSFLHFFRKEKRMKQVWRSHEHCGDILAIYYCDSVFNNVLLSAAIRKCHVSSDPKRKNLVKLSR